MPAQRPRAIRSRISAIHQQPEEPRGLKVLASLKGIEAKDLGAVDSPLAQRPSERRPLPRSIGEASREDGAAVGHREPVRAREPLGSQEGGERGIGLGIGEQRTLRRRVGGG